MKNSKFANKVGKTFTKMGFELKKHSPEILIAVGVVGTVASAVMACKATTKVNEILEMAKETVSAINNCMTDETTAAEYTQEDIKKAVVVVYAQTGIKLAKLYAPAIAVGVLSLGCIISSHNILRKRNIAVAAAFASVETGFKEYRSRVLERFGEDVDRELKYNIKTMNVEKTVIDEDGKENTVKTSVTVAEPNTYSDYARFFDDGCTGWEKNSEYNLMFLRAQQQYANDKLRANGFLFLNDVYDMLGIPRSKAGQVVGWVYNLEHPVGDNYVDFGIYDIKREVVRNFVNGYERAILLDFNVDGNIWDLM